MPPPQPANTNPRSSSSTTSTGSFAFQRAHPTLTSFLIASARLTQPLLLISVAANTNVFRRWSLRQRVLVWYMAYVSFYSRHVLAVLSLGWLLSGGERRAAARERERGRAAR